MSKPKVFSSGLRFALGAGQLGLDLASEVVHVAGGVHRSFRRQALPDPIASRGPADPVYALVHQGFRLPARASGHLASRLPDSDWNGRLLDTRAALNGVFGDTLARGNNPLALDMEVLGDPPAQEQPLLLFLHGLCLHEGYWLRGEHHRFCEQMRRERNLRVAHLRYNTGLSIADNGARLAQLLESLPFDRLMLIGHSMGGLVSRSALHQAQRQGLRWPERLTHLAALGSPHHGAAAERLGNQANRLLTLTPWSTPFTRLGGLRSAGIQDLRFGNLLPEDREGADDPLHVHDPRTPIPVPEDIAHLYVAATRSNEMNDMPRLRNDLLVEPPSALALDYPGTSSVRRELLHRCDHFQLLGHHRLYRLLHDWL